MTARSAAECAAPGRIVVENSVGVVRIHPGRKGASYAMGGAYLWAHSAPNELTSIAVVPGDLLGTYQSHIVSLGSKLTYDSDEDGS
jgi:hypothetical protein